MWLSEMRDGAWGGEKLGLTGEKPLSSRSTDLRW